VVVVVDCLSEKEVVVVVVVDCFSEKTVALETLCLSFSIV
jgi:hypothetical protein